MGSKWIHLFWYVLYMAGASPVGKNEITEDKDTIIIDIDSLSFLKSKGYYNPSKHSELGQILATQENIKSAIMDFQRYANIPVTGKLDKATKDMMAKPRCGMPDKVKKKRIRRYKLQGTSWGKTELTWKLENSNNDGITDQQVKSIIRRSFAKWQAVTNLQFSERNIENPDIKIRFERGKHNDQYAFDGPGGTLAHAFYPLDNKGLSGDVHFDDDERFVLTTNDGRKNYKILWIAVHEIGHSIGLEHSDELGAIMYPWYQEFSGDDFDLTEDDVLGIQNIYGSRVIPTQPTRNSRKPTITPFIINGKMCTNYVGGAIYSKDEDQTYIFQKKHYYLLKGDTMGVKSGPKPVGELYEGVDVVDAVFRRRDRTYVFHGDEFSVFKGSKKIKSARKIKNGFSKLPEGFGDVDAAFIWEKSSNKLYIFKGTFYWRFSEIFNSDDYTMDRNYPKRISINWMGLPPSIDAVFQWKNGETYFFKDKMYYRWNFKKNRVHPGYPQKVTNSFLECQPGSFLSQRNPNSSSKIEIWSINLAISLGFLHSYFVWML